jgi:nucleotidyltransferase/DNA polymerase involved in DNA repair
MVGLDEAYLDITLSDPEMISQEIKEAIKPYTATMGIAVNKLLAKLCSSMEKSDSVKYLQDSEE